MHRFAPLGVTCALLVSSACSNEPGTDAAASTETETEGEGDGDGDPAGDGDGDPAGEGDGDSAGDGDGDGDSAGDGDAPMFDNYGTIRVVPQALGGDTALFDNTVEVRAIVHYQSCLQDFYLLDNPLAQMDGPDGAMIFDEFSAALCQFPGMPTCSGATLVQTLIDSDFVYSLRVSFAIDDPSTLQLSEIHVGPLPTMDFAGCTPEVELRQGSLAGFDDQGTPLWGIASLPGANTAITDQAEALQVEVIAQ